MSGGDVTHSSHRTVPATIEADCFHRQWPPAGVQPVDGGGQAPGHHASQGGADEDEAPEPLGVPPAGLGEH